jgi:hypothetical protein
MLRSVEPETRNGDSVASGEGRGSEGKGTESFGKTVLVWTTLGVDGLLSFFQSRTALSDEGDGGTLVAFSGDGGGECRKEEPGFERIGKS